MSLDTLFLFVLTVLHHFRSRPVLHRLFIAYHSITLVWWFLFMIYSTLGRNHYNNNRLRMANHWIRFPNNLLHRLGIESRFGRLLRVEIGLPLVLCISLGSSSLSQEWKCSMEGRCTCDGGFRATWHSCLGHILQNRIEERLPSRACSLLGSQTSKISTSNECRQAQTFIFSSPLLCHVRHAIVSQ